MHISGHDHHLWGNHICIPLLWVQKYSLFWKQYRFYWVVTASNVVGNLSPDMIGALVGLCVQLLTSYSICSIRTRTFLPLISVILHYFKYWSQ